METTLDAPALVRRPADPEEAALRHELRDLYDEVADLLDDDKVEALPAYFTDDCVYRVTTRENYDEGLPGGFMYCDGIAMLRDRILAIRETQVYEPRSWRHFISGLRIVSAQENAVRARANFLITESMSDEDPRVFVVGRYFDTLVRRDGQWLFQERVAVCDNHHVRRSLIMPI
jgi:anthranilate 1,2-dioxygenase small subunit